MIKSYTIIIIIFFFASCKQEITATQEYVYSSDGFNSGLTVYKLSSIDSLGLRQPEKSASDSVISFLLPFNHNTSKKLYFNKKNNGYHWEYKGNYYDTIPFKFEKYRWYQLYSKDLELKNLSASYLTLYIYTDSNFNRKIIIDTIPMPW